MAGLDPAIHVLLQQREKNVDAWHKAGHDERGSHLGQFDADSADSRSGWLAPDFRGCGPGVMAIRAGDGGKPYPRRQHGSDRAAHPGRSAAAFRAGRALHGRLHRFRDHATGARACRKAGAAQHPGAAGYAGGDRAPPRHDQGDRGRRFQRRDRRPVSRLCPSVAARRWSVEKARPRNGGGCRRRGVRAAADRGDGPRGFTSDAGDDCVPDAVALERRRQYRAEFAVDRNGGRNSRAKLVIIPDCGHLSPVEQPQATADALVEWLRI